MITRNIRSVGIELEGGINSADFEKLKDFLKNNDLSEYFSWDYDYSVYVKLKDYYNIELRFWHFDLNVFLKFVEYVFTKCNFEQNSTCGNHMHFVFVNNEKALSILSYYKTWKKFIDEYIKFSYSFNNEDLREKYLSRLNNKYCLANYNTNVVIAQLKTYNKDRSRYRAINLNSFNVHKTIEIRILPHFYNFEEAKKSILWLIETLDKIYSSAKCVLNSKTIKLNFSQKSNTFEYTVKKDSINGFNTKIKVIKL